MLQQHRVVAMFSLGLMVACAGAAYGQAYPSRPVRIVTTSAGGGNDLVARLVASGITGPLGQQVVVENRPSGWFSGEMVQKAPPDGHTLLLAGTTFSVATLFSKAPYDPIRDFAPITLISSEPSVLTVHPSVPAKTVKELIALAKAKPGELNYTSQGVGSSNHLAGALFTSMAGVNIVHVPYKGAAQAVVDLVAGQVHMRFGSAAPVLAHIKAGKLRAIAVTGAAPSAFFPGLPTIAATVPGYESVSSTVMFAPARTPDAIVRRINQETVRFLNTPEAKEKLTGVGQEVVASTPEHLATSMKNELTQLGKLIKEMGIRAD